MIDGLFCKYFLLNRNILILLSLLDRAISEKRSRLNKEKGSELLNAAVGWATGKSKALKNEIEDLRCEISTHEETIERL